MGIFTSRPGRTPGSRRSRSRTPPIPFHDWNERIVTECYAPNALARILDSDLRIVRIVNNYARMSFDIGPTLLSWLESKVPDVYSAILDADRFSRQQFSGHGSAMAQIYNHMIMPLARRADKATQAYWAVRDFEYRFGRAPEGMWLPETAADIESLEILADLGIRFTDPGPPPGATLEADRRRIMDRPCAMEESTRPYPIARSCLRAVPSPFSSSTPKYPGP